MMWNKQQTLKKVSRYALIVIGIIGITACGSSKGSKQPVEKFLSSSVKSESEKSEEITSSVTEKTEAEENDNSSAIYTEFLESYTSEIYYAFMDINQDGQDDLLLTERAVYLEKSGEYPEDGYYSDDGVMVYSIEAGKVRELGELFHSMDWYRVNQHSSMIIGFWGGQGWREDQIYYIEENEVCNKTLSYDIDNNKYYLENESISEEKYQEWFALWVRPAQYIVFQKRAAMSGDGHDEDVIESSQQETGQDKAAEETSPAESGDNGTPVETQQLEDGQYNVAFGADDFSEKDGEIYLTFKYYCYNTYETDLIINLEVGDKISYCGKGVVVHSISIDEEDREGEPYYVAYINDDIVLRTYSFNPQYLLAFDLDNCEFPKYYEKDTLSLKLSDSVCFSDQSHNADPSEAATEVDYDHIVEYCRDSYDGAFPEATTITVKNDQIISIDHMWIP